jgi:hypothetical protein
LNLDVQMCRRYSFKKWAKYVPNSSSSFSTNNMILSATELTYSMTKYFCNATLSITIQTLCKRCVHRFAMARQTHDQISSALLISMHNNDFPGLSTIKLVIVVQIRS